jgi:large subunit ribosomal protein L6
MSRIGNAPITIPQGVTVTIDGQEVVVKGPKGELSHRFPHGVTITLKDQVLTIARKNNNPKNRSLHGLARALINNMVIGVTDGYEKTLEMVGTGYRVTKQGKGLQVTVGYSHPGKAAKATA